MNSDFRKKLAFFGMIFAVILGASLIVYDFLTPNEVVPVKLVRVTVPEGFSVRQIGERLEGDGIFPAGDFIKLAQGEEGFLFRDIYEFYGHALPEDVISKMKENFERKITPGIRAEISLQKKTLRDVVVMASLLEKEAKHEGDWEVIAGILWKRLEAGMPLQVDATLTYLTGKTSAELSDEDLKIDSPYNTYRYPGLPSGPISNPGLDAIDAALNPEPSPFWYYLSDRDGVIHYAKTFVEHKLNKTKYLR